MYVLRTGDWYGTMANTHRLVMCIMQPERSGNGLNIRVYGFCMYFLPAPAAKHCYIQIINEE